MIAPVKSGRTLRERYVITRVIGRGGMGSIYLAEDNRLSGRICAIKEVYQASDLPEEIRTQGRDQFYREASVLAQLDHPNLPKVSEGQRGATKRIFVILNALKRGKHLLHRQLRSGGLECSHRQVRSDVTND